MNKESRPFGLRDKLGYMFGDFGNDFTFIFASSYLMIFYTKVLGLPGTVVGALFLGARIADAFTDITMGRIVDKMRPAKDGRFRPWIRRMCIPAAVASTLMYLYFVQSWGYQARVLYAVVTYLLWSSFCYTAVNIPYGSMASVISEEPRERASLSTYRSVGASLATLVIGTIVPLVIYETDTAGNQVVSPVRFTLTALIFGILAAGSYALCYVMCTERVAFEQKKEEKENIGQVLAELGRNKPLLALLGAALVLLLATTLGQTMNNYLFLDYFKNAKAVVWLNLVTVAAMLLPAPFISRITVNFGKKEAGVAGMLTAGIFYLLLFFLRIESIPLFMLLLFFATVGSGVFNLIVWAYITDIIDYQELETNKREDGTVYAVYSFARKLGQAFAGGLGGFALTAIGYVSDAPVQNEEVAQRIYTVATLFPAVSYLLVFAIMLFCYPLSKREVERNTAILQQRHSSKEDWEQI